MNLIVNLHPHFKILTKEGGEYCVTQGDTSPGEGPWRMEIKKSHIADMEGSRTQRLLIGLVVALACLFVALEYRLTPDDPLPEPDLTARLESELELPPLQQEQEDVTLVTMPITQPQPETKLVVADEEEAPEELLDDDETIETEVAEETEIVDEIDDIAPPPPPLDDAVDITKVDELPQFPGGFSELLKWLTRNLKYPPSLQQQKVKGRVVAEFIVNRDGSVTDIKIVTPLHRLCDDEVLRVLRLMPRWTAGKQDNQPCRTKVCIPVVFKL